MEKNIKIVLGIIAGVALGYFLFRKKDTETKPNLENELKDLAKSISEAELKNLNSILSNFASTKNKFSES